MKIVLLLNNNIYASLMFGKFIRTNKDSIEYVYIFPPRNKKRSKFDEVKFLLNLYGYFGFIKKLIQTLIFKISNSESIAIEKLLSEEGIKFEFYSSPKDKDFITHYKGISPEVAIVALPHIIPNEVINIPSVGTFNKHSSLLPNYKGVYPVFWQMLNREQQLGISVHKMTEGIDEGEVVFQKAFKRDISKSFDENYLFIIENTSQVLSESIIHIKEGTTKTILKNQKSVYYSFPKKQDIKNFKSSGNRII